VRWVQAAGVHEKRLVCCGRAKNLLFFCTYTGKELETSWLQSSRLSSHRYVPSSSSGLDRLEWRQWLLVFHTVSMPQLLPESPKHVHYSMRTLWDRPDRSHVVVVNSRLEISASRVTLKLVQPIIGNCIRYRYVSAETKINCNLLSHQRFLNSMLDVLWVQNRLEFMALFDAH